MMKALDKTETVLEAGVAEALILRAQDGDNAAFGKLYDAFARRIYAYLYRRTFCRSTAEDLLSQSFLKALEKLSTFDSRKGNFSAWIYRIARNTLFDNSRFKKRTFSAGDMWDVPSSQNVDADIEHRDLRDRLAPYLAELSPFQREILFLRVWDGLSHPEIAEITGKSEAACKMTFSRTIAFLREKMPLDLFLLMLLFKNLV